MRIQKTAAAIVAFLIVILVTSAVAFAAAELTATTDEASYAPGDTVKITGSTAASAMVALQVDDPNNDVVFVGQTTSDGQGNFQDSFTLSGTAKTGTYTVYASAGTAGGPQSAQAIFSVATPCGGGSYPPLRLSANSTPLPAGTVGMPYTSQAIMTYVTASGGNGNYTYSVDSTTLPSGLSFSGGVITGTPAAAFSGNVTLTLSDSAGDTPASCPVSLTLNNPGLSLTASNTSLPNGSAGLDYTSQTISTYVYASGGNGNYTYSVAGLPTGLSFSDGVISGTPPDAGACTVTVTVNDSAGDTPASCKLPLIVSGITTNSLTGWQVGEFNSCTLTAVGVTPPYEWSATGLPDGLTCSPDGVISGSPTDGGTYTVNIYIDSAGLTYYAILSMTVNGNTNSGGSTLPADPNVTTLAATAVTASSAVLNGEITVGTNYTINDYGFLWGTDPTNLTTTIQVGTDNSNHNDFSAGLNNLTAGTTYFFVSYADATNIFDKTTVLTLDGDTEYFTTGGQAPASTTAATTAAAAAAATPSLAPSQTQTTPPPVPAQLFSDLSASYWAWPAINNLSTMGYVYGYPDGTFKPGSPITRAEFVAISDRALNLTPYAPQTPTFNDVAPSGWFDRAVETAVYAGIVKGYGNTFQPNHPITREELVIILVNALGQQDETKASMKDQTAFTDDAKISAWARGFVVAAVKDGLLKGYPDGSFRPQGHATRAEACVMIGNFLKINK